uniref:Uncharacterized protein n=1 Tax=Cacopsylla melanoneura TaxID=428564 RepID=A0A8D8TYP7_9HEMI
MTNTLPEYMVVGVEDEILNWVLTGAKLEREKRAVTVCWGGVLCEFSGAYPIIARKCIFLFSLSPTISLFFSLFLFFSPSLLYLSCSPQLLFFFSYVFLSILTFFILH